MLYIKIFQLMANFILPKKINIPWMKNIPVLQEFLSAMMLQLGDGCHNSYGKSWSMFISVFFFLLSPIYANCISERWESCGNFWDTLFSLGDMFPETILN